MRVRSGYMPQKGVLFSGDIASNILFGNPDGGEAVMREAAQIAQAEEFIEAKPEKYTATLHREAPMYPKQDKTASVHCESHCKISGAVYL